MDLQQQQNDYAATHCRVRHPGRFSTKQNPDGKVPGTSADVSGLPWNVPANRHMAIQTALRAFQCTEWVRNQHYPQAQKGESKTTTMNTLYFLSDNQELVEYMVDRMPLTENHHNTNNDMVPKPAQPGTSPLDRQVQFWKESSSTTVVSRNVGQTPATHFDREKKVPKRTHQATFVDLYLARGATYLVFGVGNFACAVIYFCGLKGMMPGILQAMEQVAQARGMDWNTKLKEWQDNHQWHVEVY